MSKSPDDCGPRSVACNDVTVAFLSSTSSPIYGRNGTVLALTDGSLVLRCVYLDDFSMTEFHLGVALSSGWHDQINIKA